MGEGASERCRSTFEVWGSTFGFEVRGSSFARTSNDSEGDSVHEYLNHINGRDAAAVDGRTFTAFNPTTGGPWGTFALAGPEDVDQAVAAAANAFRQGPWSALSPTRRGRLLMQWGEMIAEHADRIAAIETEQNGKLVAEMR